MKRRVRIGNETQEFTYDEYHAFMAANPEMKPEYPNRFWGRLGLRPIFGFWQNALRATAIIGFATILFMGFMLWENWYFAAGDFELELETYGPFCIMGQAEDELTARKLAQKDLDELVAELNLLTGEFDIVRAEVISEDWNGRIYEANVGLFGSTQLMQRAPSLKVIAIN